MNCACVILQNSKIILILLSLLLSSHCSRTRQCITLGASSSSSVSSLLLHPLGIAKARATSALKMCTGVSS